MGYYRDHRDISHIYGVPKSWGTPSHHPFLEVVPYKASILGKNMVGVFGDSPIGVTVIPKIKNWVELNPL